MSWGKASMLFPGLLKLFNNGCREALWCYMQSNGSRSQTRPLSGCSNSPRLATRQGYQAREPAQIELALLQSYSLHEWVEIFCSVQNGDLFSCNRHPGFAINPHRAHTKWLCSTIATPWLVVQSPSPTLIALILILTRQREEWRSLKSCWRSRFSSPIRRRHCWHRKR